MTNSIKARVGFIAVFFAAIIVACCAITVFCAKEVTAHVYYYNSDVKVTDTHYTSKNGHVEVKKVSINDDGVKATFVPKSFGYDTITFCTETDQPEQNMELYLSFFSGPFDTIFIFNPLADFEGSVFVICLLMIATLVVTAVLINTFVDLVRRAMFGYTMVACGGIGLFCLHYLIVSVYTLVGSATLHYTYGFGNYILEFTKSGAVFSRSFAAGMAAFCTLLIISNLSLIRHEGFRIQNLLGVVLGVVWISGFVLSSFLEEKTFDDIYYTPVVNGINVIISYFECMLFSTALSAFLSSRNTPPYDRDYIVILGCAIRKDGTLTPILRGRVDAAIEFARKQLEETGRQAVFVPSGGQGADEVISEGEAMKRYLTEQGIDEKYILPEMKSVNTFENIKFSKEIIENDAQDDYNAAFATTNYHIFRGYTLSKKLGLENARGISAKTKWYFYPNAFLRELVGLIFDKWKLHLFVILFILVIFTVIFYITV